MIFYKSINQQNTSLNEREEYFNSIRQQINQPSVFLQTCNRIELYAGTGDLPDAVARHLFRVVSGLESALVGERAVQGQVKEAYLAARERFHLSAQMHKLFEFALLVGKRVRNETEISHGAVSHSLAAIEIIEREGIDLSQAAITIIGVNKLTSDILKFLNNKGARMVFLANRSVDKARALADTIGCKVYGLDEKLQWITDTDILISATSAPHLIVKREDVPAHKKMLAIDLAFPRDIDPSLANYENVTLYNITDVEHRVQHNIQVRQSEITKAEKIIEEEITELQQTLQRRKEHLYNREPA
jgi:glutamyl-tRNA reductase